MYKFRHNTSEIDDTSVQLSALGMWYYKICDEITTYPKIDASIVTVQVFNA